MATTSCRSSRAKSPEGPRREFFYFTDTADLFALSYGDWKVHFKTIDGNLFTGQVRETNVPLVVNLRMASFRAA